MGIETELDGIPAEGLGGLRIGVSPLEMVERLRDARLRRHPPQPGRDPQGRVPRAAASTIPSRPSRKRVLPEAVAYEVTQDPARQHDLAAPAPRAYTGCYGQAGKTGTIDDFTDAWFVGYQPNLSTAVWVGYPESNAI